MWPEIKTIEYTFPKNKISNSDLSLMFFDYDFSEFETKFGIKNRYWVVGNETALDLAIIEKYRFTLVVSTQPRTPKKLETIQSTGALELNHFGCNFK